MLKMNELKLWEKYSKEVDKINSRRWKDCLKIREEMDENAKKLHAERLKTYNEKRSEYLLKLEKYNNLPFYKKIFTENPYLPFGYLDKPRNWYIPSFVWPLLEHKSYENFLDWRVKNKL
jgi:hypothetical protein